VSDHTAQGVSLPRGARLAVDVQDLDEQQARRPEHSLHAASAPSRSSIRWRSDSEAPRRIWWRVAVNHAPRRARQQVRSRPKRHAGGRCPVTRSRKRPGASQVSTSSRHKSDAPITE
jgi:hypothetical protein